MNEITMMNLLLIFKIPDSKLTINGLIQGLSDGVESTTGRKEGGYPKLYGTIISILMKALEEQIATKKLSKELEVNSSDVPQSWSWKVHSFLRTIFIGFRDLWIFKENQTFPPLLKYSPFLPMMKF